jgi:N-acyl-D-amino-acid deacylase
MARLLEQALDEGAAGFSTGLIYTPGLFSEPEEVLALARVAAARGALYATHMRSEGGRLLEAIDEVLDLARRTGVRTQISHLKTAGRANWSKLDAALERIRAARAQGWQVHADRYPYIASGTSLDSRLPAWAQADGNDAILARLHDPAAAARLAREIAESTEPAYWDGVMIGGTHHPELRRFRGATVTAVARDFGCDPVEAYLRILRLDTLHTQAFFFGMSKENMRRIYAEPWVMVGSDASIRSLSGPLSADHPHPRAFGAFARFLRLALDGESGLPPEEAIRRMTSLPAEALGLRDRGRLQPGAWADVAVFDPARVRDKSTYAAPHQYAEGVRWTIVNGRIAFDGRQALARPGRWLAAGTRG